MIRVQQASTQGAYIGICIGMRDERRDCAIKDKRIVIEKKAVSALSHPGALVCGLAETQIDLVREYLNARKLLSQHCHRGVRGTAAHVEYLGDPNIHSR